ncbi:MAG: hypothetical protein HY551_07200, partial [Elusimicrobia bacterium]|nr:hypothetical protein [Elusimicrobiota bacterium]
LDQEHESPRVRLSMEAIDALIRQTTLAGHPKQRYYELMKSGHPGGGFFVYRIRRDPWELGTGPRHTQFSQQAHLTIDVKTGLEPARAQGVELVVWVGRGGDFSRLPGLERFYEEVSREGTLLADFIPLAGSRGGPHIAIYRVPGT